ncbi:hypothetical protein GCM10010260_76800 [Streptomyces filipinensis]|uniref:Uncharacterized protein n=1 Tax=Streptomyces filipinensis TaxID=66887 RepID=A0A918IKG6_9ACTN|nr:hypothetical protein GCM10010260_76800 [Streptomyces filipinensis]
MTATWAGFILPGCGFDGAALAAPDWTAAAIRAATPARATVAVRRCAAWEVRLREEELLLNTDSFCVTAGRAARGDRTVGWDVRAEQGVTRNHVQADRAQQGWHCGVAVSRPGKSDRGSVHLSGPRHKLGRKWFVVRMFMFVMRTVG